MRRFKSRPDAIPVVQDVINSAAKNSGVSEQGDVRTSVHTDATGKEGSAASPAEVIVPVHEDRRRQLFRDPPSNVPRINPETGILATYWGLQLSTRQVDGFWGGKNWDRTRFCDTLYRVLYDSAEGFHGPENILNQLWTAYGVNGSEVARRNGYKYFELMLKHPDFSDVVQYESLTSEEGEHHIFLYRASMSKRYEMIRRRLPKPKKTGYSWVYYMQKKPPKNAIELLRINELLEKEETLKRRTDYGDSDPEVDNFELTWDEGLTVSTNAGEKQRGATGNSEVTQTHDWVGEAANEKDHRRAGKL